MITCRAQDPRSKYRRKSIYLDYKPCRIRKDKVIRLSILTSSFASHHQIQYDLKHFNLPSSRSLIVWFANRSVTLIALSVMLTTLGRLYAHIIEKQDQKIRFLKSF